MTYTIKKSEDVSHETNSEDEASYGEELLDDSGSANNSNKSNKIRSIDDQ